jgi:hypothetical protein
MPALEDLRRGLDLCDEVEDLVDGFETPGSATGVLTPEGEETCRRALADLHRVLQGTLQYLEGGLWERHERLYRAALVMTGEGHEREARQRG